LVSGALLLTLAAPTFTPPDGHEVRGQKSEVASRPAAPVVVTAPEKSLGLVVRGSEPREEAGGERAAQRRPAQPREQEEEQEDEQETMVFALDGSAPDDGTLPPSEILADALRTYASGEHLRAASGFRTVVEGRSADSRQSVDKARFFLVKSLHHLGYDHAAAVVLEEISRAGAGGAYFDEALPWLAAVGERVPDDPILVEAAGRYEASALHDVADGESRAHYDHLLYLMGRARYEQRRLGQAVALFRRIDRQSEYWVPARFFTAVAYVRRRRARPAVAAFRSVIRAID
jgi:hypothetical protein